MIINIILCEYSDGSLSIVDVLADKEKAERIAEKCNKEIGGHSSFYFVEQWVVH